MGWEEGRGGEEKMEWEEEEEEEDAGSCYER